MGTTKDGALKGAAKRIGISLEGYLSRIAAGLKHCTACRQWLKKEQFKADASRSDGLSSTCTPCRSAKHKKKYEPRERVSRMGEFFAVTKDGDKKQARSRVNNHVHNGLLPSPNSAPCTDCGHVWKPGGKRHEYDHHLGYSAEHQLSVQPVCSTCHHDRDNLNQNKTACLRGHIYDEANTGRWRSGRRYCRACRRQKEKIERTPEWWRARRTRKKAENGRD